MRIATLMRCIKFGISQPRYTVSAKLKLCAKDQLFFQQLVVL